MWGIELQRTGEIALARQIYKKFCDRITSGQLPAGEELPSTRELAKQLSVARNTVCEAYDMLTAEGYLISRQGAATRVAPGLQLDTSLTVRRSQGCRRVTTAKQVVDFRTGQPDISHFPVRLWNKLLRNAADSLPVTQWGYTGPEGNWHLREEIAAWLLRSRGIEVSPEDIFITAGSTQALHLIAALLYRPGSSIIVEDPCHYGMLRVLEGQGFAIQPVPVDAHGLQTDQIRGSGAYAAYVTPSHQFPLGGILSAGRRAELIRIARNEDMYIIEDDYDSEFRYNGPPIAPLYTMDRQRVLYVGSFSKIVFPGLRIGYAILPYHFQRRWCQRRTYLDVQNPPFEQLAIAEFLHSRKLDRHIQRMRHLYGQRRQLLLKMLATIFSESAWQTWGDAAGLHLAVEFHGGQFDKHFKHRCRLQGLRIPTVEQYAIRKNRHKEKLLLGYGHLEAVDIEKGLTLLRQVMHYKT